MTAPRLVTLWLATAALLVGLGSDLDTEDRGPVSDDPTTRLERALVGPTQDEPVGDAPAGPLLPQGDAGATRLGVVSLLGIAAAYHERVSRPESSPTRGPPGEPAGRRVVPAPSRPASTTLRSTRPTAGASAVVCPSAVHAS